MSLFRALGALLAPSTRLPHVQVPPERPRPFQSPIHPPAGWAEGTEPEWMTRWDMWADTLGAPAPRKGAA